VSNRSLEWVIERRHAGDGSADKRPPRVLRSRHDDRVSLPYSKSRIDRAGDALRAHQSGQAPLKYEELMEELAIEGL
jgi:hypothetical protein